MKSGEVKRAGWSERQKNCWKVEHININIASEKLAGAALWLSFENDTPFIIYMLAKLFSPSLALAEYFYEYLSPLVCSSLALAQFSRPWPSSKSSFDTPHNFDSMKSHVNNKILSIPFRFTPDDFDYSNP